MGWVIAYFAISLLARIIEETGKNIQAEKRKQANA